MAVLSSREAAGEYIKGDPFFLKGMISKWCTSANGPICLLSYGCYFAHLPKGRWESLASSRNFDPKHHHQLLDLQRYTILSVPAVIDIEHFLYESGSQPDVFQTQDYLTVDASRTRT